MKGFALITGAARRIGKAIALQLAKDGYDIVVHYHRSSEEAAQLAEQMIALGRKAVLAEIDLAHSSHVAKLIPSLAAELGTLTALVNNASLFELDKDDPGGERHRLINTEAPRILCEAFHAQIPEGQTGGIVNILDGAPREQNLEGYYQSKQALRAATLAMAKNFAPRTRVNGIEPGPVLPNIRQSPQHFEKQLDATPLKISITPEDIARSVSFLLSSPAVTGQILAVNGGFSNASGTSD